MQLGPADLALSGGLAVQPEQLPQLLLSSGTGSVDLVAKDQDGAVSQLFVSQQGLQLDLALVEPCPVAAVNQEHDGVHSWEVILPHTPGLVMASKVKGCEPDSVNRQLLRRWVQRRNVLGHSVIFQHVK